MNRNSIVVFMIMVLCVVVAGTAVAQSDQPDAPEVAIPVVTPLAPPDAPEIAIPVVTQADPPTAPEAVITTKFTHQGQIKRNGALFNGACDMRFALWNAVAAGTQLAVYTPPAKVSVNNGVFAVEVDFGNHFKGEARWIQTEAKCADDTAYTALPRVALNPALYAIGLLPGAQMDGNVAGTAGILRVLNAGPGAALVGLATSSTGETYGVLGNAFSPNGSAVFGYSDGGATGVVGYSNSTGAGVYGESQGYEGVRGVAHNVNHGAVVGVHDAAGGIAVYGVTPNGGYAGYFQGNVQVAGNLSTSGNVGIGTANPLATLDVNGGIRGNSLTAPADLFVNATGRIALRTAPLGGLYGERVTILSNGNVGIGTTSPGAKLTVRGPDTNGATVAFRVESSSGYRGLQVYDDGTAGVGQFAGISTFHACWILSGTWKFSQCASAAEYVPTIDSGLGLPEPADLVSIAPSVKNPYGDMHSPFVVTKSSKPCDDNLLGFIVNPELGADGKKLNDHYLPLAIYGYFPAKVTLENGAIQRGDALTSSSKPGYAMKATQACKIIGYALEDANAEGTIQVFANLGENSAPEVASLREQMQKKDAQIAELNRQVETMQQQNAALDQRFTRLEQIAGKDSEATPSLNINWLLVGGIVVFSFVLVRRGQKER